VMESKRPDSAAATYLNPRLGLRPPDGVDWAGEAARKSFSGFDACRCACGGSGSRFGSSPTARYTMPMTKPRKKSTSGKAPAAAKPWEHAKAGEGSATDELATRFVESLSYDRRLYKHDIAGSRAHAAMLC